MARRRRRRSGFDIEPAQILTGGGILLGAVGAIALLGFFCSSILQTNGGICAPYEENPDKPGYCKVPDDAYDEIVVVTGNTKNSPEPNLNFNDGDLQEAFKGAFYNTDEGNSVKVSVVSVSGDNNSIKYKKSDREEFRVGGNMNESDATYQNLVKRVSDAIKESPSKPGANYIGAIMEAKRLISSSAKNPLIIVYGSGLSDNGLLNFASEDFLEEYWHADKKDIKAALKNDGNFEEDELDGISIKWYNLGKSVSPQKSLSDTDIKKVKKIYESVFEYLGAEDMDLDLSTEVNDETMAVASDFDITPTIVQDLEVGAKFSVNEKIGRFEPDLAILINPGEVEEALKPFAKHFDYRSDKKLKITGYVALCDPSYSELGAARAQVIASLLTTKFNIPADKIEVHGEGGIPPLENVVNNTCDNMDPEIMAQRRTVIIEVIKE